MKPEKGAIAICSKGMLGLITSETPVVKYYGETIAITWTGIQLENNVGSKWSSKNPKVVGHIRNFKKEDNDNYKTKI